MFEASISVTSYERIESPNGDGSDELLEENGWIEPSWSMTDVIDIGERVEPKEFDTLEEAIDWIESYIGTVDKVNVERGNYYAEDAVVDYKSGISYNYAGHIEEVI